MTTRMVSIEVALAFIIAVLLYVASASDAHAQAAAFTSPGKAVGAGVWYGVSRIMVAAAPSTAAPDVKGVLDVVPAQLNGEGASFVMSYGSWGFNVGYTAFGAQINKKADVQQDLNPTNDPTVLSMQGRNIAVNLLFQPLTHFLVGYGQDHGTITFQMVDPTGQPLTRKLRYDKDFYVLAFVAGFDPSHPKPGFGVILYAKLPASTSGDVGSSAYGAGAGAFF